MCQGVGSGCYRPVAHADRRNEHTWHVLHPSVHRLTQYVHNIWIEHRHWHHVNACRLQVLRYIEGCLICLQHIKDGPKSVAHLAAGRVSGLCCCPLLHVARSAQELWSPTRQY